MKYTGIVEWRVVLSNGALSFKIKGDGDVLCEASPFVAKSCPLPLEGRTVQVEGEKYSIKWTCGTHTVVSYVVKASRIAFVS